MIISVASGKGGTGKTTVALLLASARIGATVVDCDVEEPNGHLFLAPEMESEIPVTVMIPAFDKERCDGCGRCAEVCLFNALAVAGKEVILFDELCHSCGGCILACPQGAVKETAKPVGAVRVGAATKNIPGARLVDGLLNVGIPAAGPVIKKMKQMIAGGDVIVDCPPGTACSMVLAVSGSNYCLLVTEPTPFGLHDLRLAAGVVKMIGVPAGVVINKSDSGAGDAAVENWCRGEGIEVLARIPHSEQFAQEYAEGRISPVYQDIAREIWTQIGGRGSWR